jgi:hypothetical protein
LAIAGWRKTETGLMLFGKKRKQESMLFWLVAAKNFLERAF